VNNKIVTIIIIIIKTITTIIMIIVIISFNHVLGPHFGGKISIWYAYL